MYVIGADGCTGGWISCRTNGESIVFDFHPSLEILLSNNPDAARIAVDIPIGLAENEPRCCDIEARELLGSRRSSVFPAPDRRILEAFANENLDYQQTSALSKRLTGKGISKQTYNILDKIAEADSLLTPKLQEQIAEVHPELSFLALAGHPMRFAKKKPEGFAERLKILREYFANLPVSSRADAKKISPYAQPDDVLDAAAAAASALRIVGGGAVRVPAAPQTDSRGLRTEISF